jgi:phosphoribosylformylglycinamidine synthase I
MVNGKPRALILKGPGTNCDVETAHACRRVGFEVEVVPVRALLAEPKRRLEEARLFVVPGGFSYGDDLGSGTVLGNELRRIRPLLWDYVRTGGLVLGICNGFQILTRAGLLPDPMDGRQTASLTFNDSGRFEARWIRLRVASSRSVFFGEEGAVIELPVAHAEGKFVARDANQLDLLKRNGQVVLQYVDGEGRPTGAYPANPNGSTDAIAGLCDASGRVLGLMPHPERFQEPTQHPEWTRRRIEEAQGLGVFRNALEQLSQA